MAQAGKRSSRTTPRSHAQAISFTPWDSWEAVQQNDAAEPDRCHTVKVGWRFAAPSRASANDEQQRLLGQVEPEGQPEMMPR